MKPKKQIDIFIVDDNKVFSLALKGDIENTFNNIPIRLHLFETGEKCVEKFRQVMPQVVILDYFLDSMDAHASDGIEVLDQIKKINPKTNVIMLSNNDHMDIAVKAMHHGASDYVVKTETKFKKINYSLYNIFRILDSERSLKNMKQFIYVFLLIISGIALIAIVLEMFAPELINR